jgi:hypothetical protein
MPIHLKQYEMVQALFHDQSSLNFETNQIHYVFSYVLLLSASCLENKVLCDKRLIPCVLLPTLSAGPLLATHLAKPLFRMIYLGVVKQWKVRSFVKLSTILMYS